MDVFINLTVMIIIQGILSHHYTLNIYILYLSMKYFKRKNTVKKCIDKYQLSVCNE